jgi:hypothetical protein
VIENVELFRVVVLIYVEEDVYNIN